MFVMFVITAVHCLRIQCCITCVLSINILLTHITSLLVAVMQRVCATLLQLFEAARRVTHTASNFLHDLPKRDTCFPLNIHDLPYLFDKCVVYTGQGGS